MRLNCIKSSVDRNYEISDIKNSSEDFKIFLYSRLDDEVKELLLYLSLRTDVYIFSGIIRDYFLNNNSIRDLDIVLGEDLDFELICKYIYPNIILKRNSFGGYKIVVNGFRIDVWTIYNTWGIVTEKRSATKHSLINSAFFNFSAILYDFKDEEFYCDEIFVEFLNEQIIDIVYERNPNIPLCIVNSLYYKNKLSLPLSSSLKTWIKSNFSSEYDFNKTQLNHFGKIIYRERELFEFLIFCALDNKL